ncbi:MAG: hypothetical protein HYR56_21835 [Acidobacteria bacterium]|nr:hypothetical protein [Acidobacteriota bacterium]MBI3425840.1 hypothetical protein [Acidobacteriota bacterium]
MTTQQILLMDCLYLALLGAVIYFTRATAWRIVGALAGGAAAGLLALGAIVFGEAQGWWRVPSGSVPYFRLQLYLGLAISMTPTYLIIWRVVRRFGWRGLAVFLGAVAVIGPPRDYLIVAAFPEWMVFAPGVAPVLADAATYVGIVALGYAVMRLVAGPAQSDRLARRSRDAA